MPLGWQAFSSRVDGYVAAVRKEADELAMQELRISKEEGGEEVEGQSSRPPRSVKGRGARTEDADCDNLPVCWSLAALTDNDCGFLPSRRRVSKTVHPELTKFKLEKQV